MNIHVGWSKMLVNTVLSQIESNRKVHKKIEKRYQVDITKKKIFDDLKYIFNYIGGYRNLYIKFFEDMEEFNFLETSSVTDNKDDLPSLYKEIKLYEHTINVVTQFLDIAKKDIQVQQNIDIYLIIVLLHDFGKSHNLCNFYNINLEEEHCNRSAYYFKEIVLKYFKDEEILDNASFTIIYGTLFNHHKILTEEEKKENPYYLKLIESDKKARALEKSFLDNQREISRNDG